MDLERAPTSCRHTIWQKRCNQRPGWFSRSPNFCRKKDTEISGIQHNNSAGRPPPLLRLSSTGESVDDIAELRSFDPSNLQGSDLKSRDRVQLRPNPNSKPAGIFDCLTKFAFSVNTSSKDLGGNSSAMSFVRESSNRPLNQKQVDLGVLMEKFDCPQDKMERLGVGQNMPINASSVPRPQQGGMNGYVKEGIYHTFAKKSAGPHVGEKPPFVQAFSFLNGNSSPFYHQNRHYQHPHPYMHRNHFMPGQQPTTSLPFGCGSARSDNHTMGRSQSHLTRPCVSFYMRDLSALVNQFNPNVQLQYVNNNAAHAVKHKPQQNSQSQQKVHPNRNHMMKHGTEMTQQNQNPNKPTRSTPTGSVHQRRGQSPCAKNKVPKPSNCGPHQDKSAKQSVLKCPFTILKRGQDLKTVKQHTESSKQSPKETDSNKCDVLNSVTSEAKSLQLQEKSAEKGGVSEIEVKCQISHTCLPNQSVHHHVGITSSDGSQCCERNCSVTAEPDTQNSTGAKSADNETSTDGYRAAVTRACSGNHRGEKSHLQDSQISFVDLVDVELMKNPCCETETRQLMSDGKSAKPTLENCECEESKCLSVSSLQVSSSQSRPIFETQSSESESKPIPAPHVKPLHPSLAALLSETASNDSDFSDSDWDSPGSPPPSSDSWDFLKCWDDPYNPLHGWKCASHLSQQPDNKQDSKIGKLDSSADDELDSGISLLQTQHEETDDVRAQDSDSWDEEDSNQEETSRDSCQLWKSFCSSDDPYNPLNGWRWCSTSQNNPEKSDSVKNTCCTTETTKDSPKTLSGLGVQGKIRDDSPTLNNDLPETTEQISAESKTLQSGKLLAPQKAICEPSRLHPSVQFILGTDDSDSESDSDDQDEFDSPEADNSHDNVWNSLQMTSDPYNPLQGWKWQNPNKLSSEKLSAINAEYERLATLDENSTSKQVSDATSHAVNFAHDDKSVRRSSAVVPPSTCRAIARSNLKRASSTGCLWVPADDRGPGRPFLNKKVHFCEASPTVISFEVPSWSSEYCASRKGPWEKMALDRCRFKDRIRCIESHIGHIFTPSHRHKVRQRLQIKGV